MKKYIQIHCEYLRNHKDNKINIDGALSCNNVREFDQHAVVPVFGYKDVEHYYHESSAYKRAHNIHIPTLAVSSEDDPVCNSDGCPNDITKFGDGLVVVRTEVGGHVAFADGFFLGTSSWQDTVAIDWFQSCL